MKQIELYNMEITRTINATPDRVFAAWTQPDLLKKWFAPKPVETTEAVIYLVRGGRFYTNMKLPDGTMHPTEGCVLDFEQDRRFVITDALTAGWIPAVKPFFTALLTFEPNNGRTEYRAEVRHKNEEDRAAHEEMGFYVGWNAATDQLARLAESL